MDKKLVTSIGGLGNQMFCYAFYKKLCREYPNVLFYMDISDVWDGRYERGAEFLRVFPNVEIKEASAKDIRQIEGKYTFTYRGKGSRYLRKVVDFINKRTMETKKKFCITEELFEKKNGMISEKEWDEIQYFDGFWQNVEYYLPYMDELQHDFQYVAIEDEENRRLMKKIKDTYSVSVHVRRGDYVGEVLDILDTEYYSEIIRKVLEKQPESTFFFFSNDSEYVKREYAWLDNKIIVEHNTGMNSFRDMQLMSMCKENIIANSTFSMWAGMLNQNKDRVVYYPSHYYQNIKMQDMNLPGFVKCKVKDQA